MTFASLEFGFLLLVTLALHYMLPPRASKVLLLVASYVFYCFWNPVYGILIFATTLVDYGAALGIGRAKTLRARRLFLWASIASNLGMLGYFKYTDFALDSLRLLLGPLGENLPAPLHLILPAGISFYTFQTMSYTIDVYRGKLKPERDFLLVALYVAFFPQLVAGPIERAGDLMPQLARRGAFRLKDMEAGGRLILWGLLKKLVVADRLLSASYDVYVHPERYNTGETAFAVLAMLIVIYLDFSAYSEIAAGTARLFGVQLSRNFDFPQVSLNIADFWRRWHMTMSTWVRDYLYIPLGGFRPRNMIVHARIMMITMGLVGLWHGAEWSFVLWGLGHGACLVIYHFLALRVFRKRRGSKILSSSAWRFGSWLFNTWIRALLSVLFFSPDLKRAGAVMENLFGHLSIRGFLEPYVLVGFATLAAFSAWHYLNYRFPLAESFLSRRPAMRGAVYAAGIYVLLFGAVPTSEPFIYYQF